MSPLAALASLALAVIIALWTARAILGAIVALLLKHRHRATDPAPASSRAA